jgi:hypothetical protein
MFRHVKKGIHVSVKRTLETSAPQRVVPGAGAGRSSACHRTATNGSPTS